MMPMNFVGPQWMLQAPRQQSGSHVAPKEDPLEVFFSNVPYSTTEETLLQIFSKGGTVANLRVYRTNDGTSRGMGICRYQSPESVSWTVRNLREHEVDGRPMWVATHTDKSKGGDEIPPAMSCRVFFSNVPYEVEESTIRTLFEEVGRITDLKLFRKGGKFMGMGQCTYEAPTMATLAIRVLRDRNVGGRPIWVSEDVNSMLMPSYGACKGMIFPMNFWPGAGCGRNMRFEPYGGKGMKGKQAQFASGIWFRKGM